MKNHAMIRILFILAAVYDGVLGLVFLAAGPMLFDRFNVEPPNHWGYIHFPAALLLIFAVMFAAVALRPVANRNLIPYGMLLKVSYCGLVFYHWAATGVPTMWKPFAIMDVLFLVAFVWAYVRLRAVAPTMSTTK